MLYAMMMLGYRLWKSRTRTGEVYRVDYGWREWWASNQHVYGWI